MTNETRTTPAALVATFGPTYQATNDRCSDNRPVFQGANGTRRCACEDGR